MILTEYFPISINKQSLLEGVQSNSPTMVLKGVVLQRANSKNRNGRVYPYKVLKNQMDDYVENFVNHNRALGELDHSNENVVNLKNVSHKINNVYWKGDDVLGDVEILNYPEFPAGKIAAGLLLRNIPVGISSRGYGSVDEALDGTSTVNDDFKLLCFDLVSFESTQGSNMILKEGIEVKNNISYTTIDSVVKELICNNTGYCPC